MRRRSAYTSHEDRMILGLVIALLMGAGWALRELWRWLVG